MFYSLSGKLTAKNPDFAVLEVNGVGFKISISPKTSRRLPKIGSKSRLFTFFYAYENDIALYGFLSEEEKEIFELLISVNGIGPKAALKIVGSMKIPSFLSAVKHGRGDILVKTAGIGAKKAQKIILELKDKIKETAADANEIELAELDSKIKEILKSLGYKQNEIKETIGQIPEKQRTLEARLKFVLKSLGK